MLRSPLVPMTVRAPAAALGMLALLLVFQPSGAIRAFAQVLDPDRATSYRVGPPASTAPAPDDNALAGLSALPRPAGAPALDDPRDGKRLRVPGGRLPQPAALTDAERAQVERALGTPIQVGGDDQLIELNSSTYYSAHVAISSDGIIFVAVQFLDYDDVSWTEWIRVYRSQDGGDTFAPIGEFHDFNLTRRLWDLDVAEGLADRVFLFFQDNAGVGGFKMRVAFADIGSTSPTWTVRDVFNTSGVSYLGPSLDSDAGSYSSYYLYAVSSGLDGNGDDVWFSRSLDQGLTWSAPYRIASLTSSGNLMYSRPHVSYGFGGVVHVAFTLTERLQDTFDDGVRYLRALNFGTSSSDWQPMLNITSTGNAVQEDIIDIDASTNTGAVNLVHSRGYFLYYPHNVLSTNSGAGWSAGVDLPFDVAGDFCYRASTQEFVGIANALHPDKGEYVAAISRAAASDLHVWSEPAFIGDVARERPTMALDASHGDRVGMAATNYHSASWFDAEWRSDPGYPNLDAGFPVALSATPNSPPAVVNVDADPQLEIVFTTSDGNVHVYNHDGSPAAGWPRDVGSIPANSPAAVGDLNASGRPEVVVGTTTGLVYAFDGAGNVMAGFPVNLGTGAPTYVSIGAIKPPNPRWIVALSGQHMYTINSLGQLGPHDRLFTGTFSRPAAIGDTDEDGRAEMAVLSGPVSGGFFLDILSEEAYSAEAFRFFPGESFSDSPTMADLDLDGDLEIVIPTSSGKMYAVHHDGTLVTGFPFVTGLGSPLTSAAMAQFLGTSEPELAFASRVNQVHVVFATGAQHTSWPQSTDPGWFLLGAPILDQVDRSSANVVIGSRDERAWSFWNTGNDPAGWPRLLNDRCELSPASGDLDLDGDNEIVFLTLSELAVLDVNYPPEPLARNRWTMYGHDAQRTGCLACPEDAVTAVEGPALPGRVSFAITSPNPSDGTLTFAYALPVRAAMTLEIFDVGGRRVRTVRRQEAVAGGHVAEFDGRDQAGGRLGSGSYYARLTVRGAGVNEGQTRRFTVVR